MRFFFHWHRGDPADDELLSLSAPNGLFRPFEDEYLTEHLRLSTVSSLRHFDIGTGTWITVLKSSPPLIIKAKGTYHFKEAEAEVHISQLVEPLRLRLVSKLVKTESSSSNPVTSPGLHTTPTSSSSDFISVKVIGDRPCRLSKFPGTTLKEVKERLQWISDNAHLGSLQRRFSAVYSCPFQSSTYHRHQNAWRWLQSEGLLEVKSDQESWKELAQTAWKASELQPPSNTIDLTKETD